MADQFAVEYKRLNDNQRQAVDLIDGALMVVAGPGTGKTQLLSLRVANILKLTDTPAEAVLCLTFTNKASQNMRQRLDRLVGKDAWSVNVHTFHGFALEIIEAYPEYFFQGASLSLVPDSVQIEIISAILDNLPLDNPLTSQFDGKYTQLNDILEALKLSKEAGLSPDKLSLMIETNLNYIDAIEPLINDVWPTRLSNKHLDVISQLCADLPDQQIDQYIQPLKSLSAILKSTLTDATTADSQTNKTTHTSKWKSQWLSKHDDRFYLTQERKRNSWWQALADVYRQYRAHLHAKGYYDYSDLIVEVNSALEQQPELLSSVRERYLYLLIDEFQDCNAAQLRLAYLVAGVSQDNPNPNIMAVGDDDQTIYAFNGAELNSMLSFYEYYPAAQTVVLDHNYRSNQAVLSEAARIIDNASNRLVSSAQLADLTKNLTAASSVKPGEIKHYVYPTRQHQWQLIADKVAAIKQADKTATVAILARYNEPLRQIAYYLQRQQLPISYEQHNNIFELDAVQVLDKLMMALSAVNQGDESTLNYLLPLILAHPVFAIPAIDLWQLALSVRKSASRNYLEFLIDSHNKTFNGIANWLIELAKLSQNQPIEVTIEHLLGLREGPADYTSKLNDYYFSDQPLSSAYLANLSGIHSLVSLVNEYALSSQDRPKLNDFNRFIDINRRQNRIISDSSWFRNQASAIELMTIHKAKGLEFDYVFLIDVIDKQWRPKRASRRSPANLPLSAYGENIDDYIRLAYVAISRAKHTFIAASYDFDESGEAVLASAIFNSLSESKQTGKDVSGLDILKSTAFWPELKQNQMNELLSPLLENYSLSSTALNQFLDVTNGGPKQYLERQLLHLPELKTTREAYGTAMHEALRHAQELTNDNSFNLEPVIAAYLKNLAEQPILTSEYERYALKGQQMLTRLFIDFDFKLPIGAKTEVPLRQVRLKDSLINGKLDSVLITGQQISIRDYKTGKALKRFSTNGSDAIKAWRQKNQLMFYMLLLNNHPTYKRYQIKTAEINYLEADEPKLIQLALSPDKSELDRFTQLIDKVYHRIMMSDFSLARYDQTISGIKAFEDDLLK